MAPVGAANFTEKQELETFKLLCVSSAAKSKIYAGKNMPSSLEKKNIDTKTNRTFWPSWSKFFVFVPVVMVQKMFRLFTHTCTSTVVNSKLYYPVQCTLYLEALQELEL